MNDISVNINAVYNCANAIASLVDETKKKHRKFNPSTVRILADNINYLCECIADSQKKIADRKAKEAKCRELNILLNEMSGDSPLFPSIFATVCKSLDERGIPYDIQKVAEEVHGELKSVGLEG